jgi:hypothetical protein
MGESTVSVAGKDATARATQIAVRKAKPGSTGFIANAER